MSGLEKVGKSNRDSSPSGNRLFCGDDVVRLKKMMMGREINLGRPFDVGGGGGSGTGCGGGGGGGPNSCNSGGATEAVGHTYGDDVSSSSSSSRLGCENFATLYSQPFDIFAAAAYSVTPYKSPEEMAATAAAFPFTFAQWKELERQAMIYKYMISSVPVPSDLLFPHSRNFSACPASLYNVRYLRNGDPEPGRCKRTDGKKWRCSRDVAPHQKYCERHLHRGRPRSRKPVEVKNNAENLKKSPTQQTTHVPSSTTVSVSASAQQFADKQPLLLFNAKNDPTVSAAASSSYKGGGPTRDLSLMMEGEMVVMDGTDQRWQHLIESNMGFVNVGSSVYGSSTDFHQNYVEQQQQQQPLNVLSYSNFSAPEIDAPTGFINAWSMNNLDSSNSGNAESSSITTNHGNLSPSLNLSIAMAAGNIVDQEMRSIECCDEQSGKEDPRWISPLFWEPFARGGPLAEALQSGSVSVSGCKNSISAPATAVSSPTGVLHQTLFSHSDSSVCNSPAPAAAAPTSEIAFHRLN